MTGNGRRCVYSLGRQRLARSLRCASADVSSTRLARVSGRRACEIHSRTARRTERGERVPVQAGGRSRVECGGEVVRHREPLDGIERGPRPVRLGDLDGGDLAGAIRPAAKSRSTRSLFGRAHPLRGLRGAK